MSHFIYFTVTSLKIYLSARLLHSPAWHFLIYETTLLVRTYLFHAQESSEVIDTIDLTEVSVWKDRELGYDNCFQIYHPARLVLYLD